jgi:predicted nucleotidyltransferase
MTEQQIANKNLIYKVQNGSNLYGTTIETSDTDFVGIFIPPKEYVIGIKRCDQVECPIKLSKTDHNQKEDTDYTIYSLLKFIHLAMGNNPNIIELLYAPVNCIIHRTVYSDTLLAHRNEFLSKKAYHTFKGYSYAQRNKLMIKKENITGRTELVEKYGYDTKFASHLIRLLLECHQILVEGTITLPLPQNNYIRDIKLGKYSLDEIFTKAEELEKLVDLAYTTSTLQNHCDENDINVLQMNLLEYYWKHNE